MRSIAPGRAVPEFRSSHGCNNGNMNKKYVYIPFGYGKRGRLQQERFLIFGHDKEVGMTGKQPPGTENEPFRQEPLDCRDMLMNAPIGAFTSTPGGRLIYANPTLARLFGYDSPQEMIESTIDIGTQRYADPNDREKIKRLLDTHDEVHHFESRFVRRDGSLFWASYSVRAVRAGKETIDHFQGFFFDVTDRKRERESLLRTQFTMDRAPDSIVWIDDEGRIVYANDNASASMGYERGELLKMKIFEIDPDFLQERYGHFKEEMRRLGSLSFESRHRTKDGRIFPVEVNARYFDFDDHFLVCGFDRDITRRKRAEAELRESEGVLRSLLEATPVGVALLKDRVFKKVNKALCRITGYTEEEMRGMMTRILYPDEAEFERIGREMYEQMVREGLGVKDSVLKRKDGERIDVVLSLSPFNPDDISAGVCATVLDVTEHRREEKEREKLKEQLDHAQRLESIGTLAGGVAHDFNNLLMGIQGNAALMMIELDPTDPHYERLTHIEEQVRSGADLTRQLLGFARGGRYALKPMNVNDIIEKTAAMFGRTKKQITIHRKYGKDLWTVEADGSQMGRVFMNLFVNAWQAMPGGGEIFLETENLFLDDATARSISVSGGKCIKITVTDIGTGMDPKTLERIFDPFFTTKGMGRGTGLGLATVYGIIKGHGGAINVISRLGHGTTFHIYLPATEKSVIAEKASEFEVLRGTETILLVDDEAMVLEVTDRMLQSLGYRVHCARNGQEAVAFLRERKDAVDLVILDIIMPGMSGNETFDNLRKINPEQKVLLSSGYSVNDQAAELLEKGCNGFLQKPYLMKELAREVRAALDAKE